MGAISRGLMELTSVSSHNRSTSARDLPQLWSMVGIPAAFAMADFNQKWLPGKKLAIACPKLDGNQESYLAKLTALIDSAEVNTISVMIMEVPCCGGLLRLAQMAAEKASRKVPIKAIVIGVDGEVRTERWVA